MIGCRINETLVFRDGYGNWTMLKQGSSHFFGMNDDEIEDMITAIRKIQKELEL